MFLILFDDDVNDLKSICKVDALFKFIFKCNAYFRKKHGGRFLWERFGGLDYDSRILNIVN